MLRFFIYRTLMMAVAAFICYSIIRQMDPWLGAAAWSGIMLVLTTVGYLLLKTTKVGERSWKNYFAGQILPFGWAFCKHPNYWPAVGISWFIWSLIGVMLALILSPHASSGPASNEWTFASSKLAKGLLIFFWVVDAGVLMLMLKRIFVTFGPTSHSAKGLTKVALILLAMIVGSVVFYLNGNVTRALLTCGLVPTIIGGGYALMIVIFLTAGKNARWN